jgi:hypothetical protein
MGKRNPIEDANLLYVAFIIIIAVIVTILIVEGTFIQEEGGVLRSEKVFSNVMVELLSSNDFETCLQITNNGVSVIERDKVFFYLNKKEIEPNMYPEGSLRSGKSWIVKIKGNRGELKIFVKGSLIYSHELP